jgi:imidazoleglycerol-phosphate dehydratase/histidinol-phosphatase
MPGVIPALLKVRSAGFDLVVVSNQDGLGTPAFPREAFEETDRYVRALFASQGVEFLATFFCPHYAADGCNCRKPGIGLVETFLAGREIDRDRSAVVGDRDTDLALARNLGVRGFKLTLGGSPAESWPEVARRLVLGARGATVHRRTRETDVEVQVDLDDPADAEVETGIGFFDHMLQQLGKHGGFRLRVQCRGDLEVDEHHTVEDTALAIGEALRRALGDKRGIGRYGFLLPMDESEAHVALDLGGRPFTVFDGRFPRERVGELPTELVPHFFRSLAEALGAAIHIRVSGENAHHMVEACFKSVARALRQAAARHGEALPTTKGML